MNISLLGVMIDAKHKENVRKMRKKLDIQILKVGNIRLLSDAHTSSEEVFDQRDFEPTEYLTLLY